MSVLIVQLPLTPPGAATEYRYAQTRDGQSLEQQGAASAATLPGAGLATDVLALVPVQALSWHLVELPKGALASAPARLRAVLDGLLEDRLLDDATALHLAVSPNAQAGQPVWIAACDKQWLHAALAPLEAAGRPVSRIVPECVPDEAGTGSRLYALGEPPLLVRSQADGVLTLPLGAAALQAFGTHEGMEAWAEPALLAQTETLLGRAPALQQAGARWVQAARTGWDLAQFDFANSARQRSFKKLGDLWRELFYAPHWRAARVGALVLLLVQLIGLNAWAWKERNDLSAKREQVRLLLTQTFPQVRLVVNAPLQMGRELALLRQSAGASSGQDLEQMLSQLGQAIAPAAAPALNQLRAMDFADGELRLKGLTADFGNGLSIAGYSLRQDGDSLLLKPAARP